MANIELRMAELRDDLRLLNLRITLCHGNTC